MADDPELAAAEHPEVDAADLSDEIAKKYAPERLLGMVNKRAGSGEALEYSLRSKYEKRLGVDLGHVRIFSGEFAEEFNRKRDAYAVTVGASGMILMGGNTDKAKGSAAHEALLAHELTHVAQAKGGNLGGGLNRDSVWKGEFTAAHEHEAHSFQNQIHAELTTTSGAKRIREMELQRKHKEHLDAALEKVKKRVLDMAADAHRNVSGRSGSTRRA